MRSAAVHLTGMTAGTCQVHVTKGACHTLATHIVAGAHRRAVSVDVLDEPDAVKDAQVSANLTRAAGRRATEVEAVLCACG